MSEFIEFPKIARLSRECVVTEKIDGTNASIHITEDGQFLVGSRTRYITPENDNYGFARWATDHKAELMQLGVGSHFGEWFGAGIQRTYGLSEKRFSLFNVARWADDRDKTKFPLDRPACCGVVPILATGLFDTMLIDAALHSLKTRGSQAAPGFMQPEGIVIYHTAANIMFKKIIEKDEVPKGKR